MNSSWLRIAPEALYWGPRNLAKVWNVKDIYITENACSATDVPAADGAARTAAVSRAAPRSRAALAFETHPCKSSDLHGCSSG